MSRPHTTPPACGNVTIYVAVGGNIVSSCDCHRSYNWKSSLTAEQLAIWTADHQSFFGINRAWVEKAADIPDETFVKAVKEAIRRRNMQPPIPYYGWTTATLWDVTAVLAGHPELVGTDKVCEPFPNLPPKVVLAKAKRLVRRKLIDGCTCGCRGNFEVIT